MSNYPPGVTDADIDFHFGGVEMTERQAEGYRIYLVEYEADYGDLEGSMDEYEWLDDWYQGEYEDAMERRYDMMKEEGLL